MKEWLEGLLQVGHITEAEFREFCQLESGWSLGKPDLRHQLECLEQIGYGIAPDPRFIFWASFDFGTSLFFNVGKFKLNNNMCRQVRSDILQIALGVIALNSGNDYSPFEEYDLVHTVENIYEPMAHSVNRFRGHLQWLLQNPPNVKQIPSILKHIEKSTYLDSEELDDFVAYTVANGLVRREKLDIANRVYKELSGGIKNYYQSIDNLCQEEMPNDPPTYCKFLTKKVVEFNSAKASKKHKGKSNTATTSPKFIDKATYGRLAIDNLSDEDQVEKAKALRWIPKTSEVVIAGRKIKGMVYLGQFSKLKEFDQFYCSACIDPSLQLGRVNDRESNLEFPVNPSYLRLNPKLRTTYLDWLATDRTDKKFHPSVIKLYMYGLDYRFFVDNPSRREKQEILAEAKRVYYAYECDELSYLYLHKFIEYATIILDEEELKPHVIQTERKVLMPSFVEIGKRINKGLPIPSDWCLSWFLNQSEFIWDNTHRNFSFEFRLLFDHILSKRFSSGFKIRRQKDQLRALYYSSSEEFVQEILFTLDGKPLPNINGLAKPFKVIESIFDETTQGLKPFGRYLMRRMEERYSIEAIDRVPKEIHGKIWESRLSFLEDALRNKELKLGFKLGEFCERMEGMKRDKLTIRQYTRIADALASAGYGISPDPRLLSKGPKIDDHVLIFPIDVNHYKMGQISEFLLFKIVEVAISVWIGSVAKTTNARVASVVGDYIESLPSLKRFERKTLVSNLQWFLANEYDVTKFRKWLESMSRDWKEDVRLVSVAMVKAYGEGNKETVSRLETLYSILGYKAQQVYSDLYSVGALDEPVAVRQTKIGPKGKTNLVGRKTQKAVALDSRKIGELVDETEKVQTVLGGVFVEESQSENRQSSEKSKPSNVVAGLDQKHSAFVIDFLSKERWTVKAFEKLANKHGLMWEGSLETINEWAYELEGEELIEEYDGFRPNRKIVDKITQRIQINSKS